VLPLPRFRKCFESNVLSDNHPAQFGGTLQQVNISGFSLPILNRREDKSDGSRNALLRGVARLPFGNDEVRPAFDLAIYSGEILANDPEGQQLNSSHEDDRHSHRGKSQHLKLLEESKKLQKPLDEKNRPVGKTQ